MSADPPAAELATRPQPAATVLLLRDALQGRGVEVLLQQRGAELRFMGGHWVFPGGRVDASDGSPALLERVRALPDEKRLLRLLDPQGQPIPTSAALSVHVAACRETFEEAGVLLAADAAGRPCAQDRLMAACEMRSAVVREPQRFADVLDSAGVRLELAELVYWSHWITPLGGAGTRFDTRFFAVELPRSQITSADGGEAVAETWIAPQEACERAGRGELRLAPPTLVTLLDLARCAHDAASSADLLQAQRGRAPLPVTPRLRRDARGISVLMPWHPDYAATPGEGRQASADWPEWLTAAPAELTLPVRPG